MCTRVAILLSCVLSLFGQKHHVPTDESGREGMLELRFITSFGESVTGYPLVIIEESPSGPRVYQGKGAGPIKLKYGSYRLRAQYSGTYPVDKAISIRNPMQLVSVCFFIAPIESPWDGNLIRGRISEGSRKRDCRWIRFVCPFADAESAEASATEGGHFALENVRPGKYLAFTMGKDGICEQTEVSILFGRPVYDVTISGVPGTR